MGQRPTPRPPMNYSEPKGPIRNSPPNGLGGTVYPQGSQGKSSPTTTIPAGQKGPYGGGRM